jgi:hypothetical protein
MRRCASVGCARSSADRVVPPVASSPAPRSASRPCSIATLARSPGPLGRGDKHHRGASDRPAAADRPGLRRPCTTAAPVTTWRSSTGPGRPARRAPEIAHQVARACSRLRAWRPPTGPAAEMVRELAGPRSAAETVHHRGAGDRLAVLNRPRRASSCRRGAGDRPGGRRGARAGQLAGHWRSRIGSRERSAGYGPAAADGPGRGDRARARQAPDRPRRPGTTT